MKNENRLQLDFGFNLDPIVKQEKPSKKAYVDFAFELSDYLTSPVIVYPSAWQDDIPKDLLKNITMSRLLCQIKGEEMASYAEVTAYMMPRTYEAPMPHEWVNIYTWASLQYIKQFKSKEVAEAAKEVAPETLTDYEMGLLKKLRIWIYTKRRAALKAKMKSEKPVLVAQPKSVLQQSLFNK